MKEIAGTCLNAPSRRADWAPADGSAASATVRLTAYRPFIDGLRAVSILAVVLYHVGVPGITGGFVGVDVFFVISGFLIISQIVEGLQRGSFSFGEFWARRALRILPPYLLVLAVSLAAAPFVLVMPDEFKEFGREVARRRADGRQPPVPQPAGLFRHRRRYQGAAASVVAGRRGAVLPRRAAACSRCRGGCRTGWAARRCRPRLLLWAGRRWQCSLSLAGCVAVHQPAAATTPSISPRCGPGSSSPAVRSASCCRCVPAGRSAHALLAGVAGLAAIVGSRASSTRPTRPIPPGGRRFRCSAPTAVILGRHRQPEGAGRPPARRAADGVDRARLLFLVSLALAAARLCAHRAISASAISRPTSRWRCVLAWRWRRQPSILLERPIRRWRQQRRKLGWQPVIAGLVIAAATADRRVPGGTGICPAFASDPWTKPSSR